MISFLWRVFSGLISVTCILVVFNVLPILTETIAEELFLNFVSLWIGFFTGLTCIFGEPHA